MTRILCGFIKKNVDLKTCLIIFLSYFFITTYLKFNNLKNEYEYAKVSSLFNVSSPIVFIGGSPRSGTTLMRVMLDAHPLLNCGEETRVIPRILHFSSMHLKQTSEFIRLKEAGITSEIVNAAASAYILEVIKRHGKNAPYLCSKDPKTLEYSKYLSELFPNSKFVLMIRDPRAIVHSVLSRHINSVGYKVTGFRENFINWNSIMESMYSQCMIIGQERCVPVFYEQLVLHPKNEMTKILNFLKIPWNPAVLNHEKFIGNKISLSQSEKSSDQVIKPVNVESLYSWVGKIPEHVIEELDEIAPMMKTLGYDTSVSIPNYGKVDKLVEENTKKIRENYKYWKKLAKKYSRLHYFFDRDTMAKDKYE